MSVAEAGQGHLRPVAVGELGAGQQPPPFDSPLPQEQNGVARGVAVGQRQPGEVPVVTDHEVAVARLTQRYQLERRQISEIGRHDRVLERRNEERRDSGVRIRFEVHLGARETVGPYGLGLTSGEGDRMRLVVLVAVGIEREIDPVELGDDDEHLALHQRGVGHGDVVGNQLPNVRAASLHRVQAHPSRPIREEIETIPYELWRQVQPG